ncbi:hypothetical protein GOP47_0017921 [Adiantum capillus-veneris]|uniref:RING-type E3 ubiquitin transferase n=1 Tax=Adiantum capillus-veneris TaxID=13818 RepID=A0A9D4UGA2_ADICA|nr:hypothetical protein GOP47_0017921 [Adiantum capillus-veneris]
MVLSRTLSRQTCTPSNSTIESSDNEWPDEPVQAPKIGIGLGKKKGKLALKYALDNVMISGGSVCLLHVQTHPRSVPKRILRKHSIKNANASAIQEYKEQLRQEAELLANEYRAKCDEKKVKAEVFYSESNSVQEGLVDQISNLKLTTLIVAKSSVSTFSRAKKEESISTFVVTHAPSFCKVMVIHKGKLHFTRDAVEPSTVNRSSTLSSTSAAATEVSAYTTVFGNWMIDTFRVASTNCHSPQEQNDTCIAEESIGARINALWGELGSGYHSISSPSISEGTSIQRPLPMHEHSLTGSNAANNESSPAFHLWLDEAEKFGQWLTIESQRQATNLKKITTTARQMHAENERRLLESMSELETMRRTVDRCLVEVELAKLQAEAARNRYEETVSELDKVSEELDGEYQLRKKAEESLEREYQLRKEAEKRLDAECQLRKEAEEKASQEATEKVCTRVTSQEQFFEYSYRELQAATNEFSDDNKLGEGSYGPVYRGKLPCSIAIKVLSSDGSQGCHKFRNEIQLLSRIHHPHIVRMLGACFDKGCIVYEHMENGSLEDRLNCKDGTPPLPWYTRFRICVEVAAALLFLHSSSQTMVHNDLTFRNILLDDHFVSKIGNIGVAKLASSNLITLYKPLGMYVHPDYQLSGIISCESDVFSLGIIMLQLLTGRQAVGVSDVVEDAVYNGHLEDVLDKSAGEWPLAEAMDLAFVGLQCADPRKKNRPNLSTKVLPDLQKIEIVASKAVAKLTFFGTKMITPSFFLCPISQEIMENPHIAADGFTYDFDTIESWLRGHDTSPMTNLTVNHKNLVPNHTLRSTIKEWQENILLSH